MNQSIGQQLLISDTKKIVWLLKRLHLLVDAAPSTRLLHVLLSACLFDSAAVGLFVI